LEEKILHPVVVTLHRKEGRAVFHLAKREMREKLAASMK